MRHIRTPSLLAILLITSDAAFLATAQTQKPKAPADSQQNLREAWGRADQLVDSLVKKVSPSLVQILVTSYGPVEEEPGRTGQRVGQQRVIGSGFVIDSEGYVVTNAHVVKGAERIQVVLQPPGADGS